MLGRKHDWALFCNAEDYYYARWTLMRVKPLRYYSVQVSKSSSFHFVMTYLYGEAITRTVSVDKDAELLYLMLKNKDAYNVWRKAVRLMDKGKHAVWEYIHSLVPVFKLRLQLKGEKMYE
jgi:hypothetical protein